MKIEDVTNKIEKFHPVTIQITLENEKEFNTITTFMQYNLTVPEAYKEALEIQMCIYRPSPEEVKTISNFMGEVNNALLAGKNK